MPTIFSYILLTIITIFPVLSLGTMIFFTFILTPTIFKFLPQAHAGPFVRKLFPIYYIFNSILILVTVLSIASLQIFNAIFYANLFVFTLFIVCQFYLMPAINKNQDKKNKRQFKILHASSVAINFVQIFMLLVITYWLFDY